MDYQPINSSIDNTRLFNKNMESLSEIVGNLLPTISSTAPKYVGLATRCPPIFETEQFSQHLVITIKKRWASKLAHPTLEPRKN